MEKATVGKVCMMRWKASKKMAFSQLDEQEKEQGKNIMWCIWQHPDSPLFGKDKMATFERYFIEAKETHLEKKNPYYELLEKEEVVDEILEEFGLHPEGAHIVNGHVPVKCKNGESPIKCKGKFWSSMEDFPAVSERDGNCRVYPCLQLLWSCSGCP